MSTASLLNTYGLALFILLTILRQGTHLIHLKHHKSDKNRYRYSGAFFSTAIMYILYSVCWIGSILTYLLDGSQVPYYCAGIGALIVGIWLRYLGVKELGRNFASSVTIRNEHHLVTSGVYSFFRHPIHLGLLLELTGMAIIAPSTITSAALVFMVAVIIWRNRREDDILIEFFGNRARDYCRRVPAMNPFPLLKAGLRETVSNNRGELAQ